jgi:hypothetical protein
MPVAFSIVFSQGFLRHQHHRLQRPRLVSAASPASASASASARLTDTHAHRTCLAAAAPRSTSRASATAPARATSPTNSNGTFPEPRPTRPPALPSPSIHVHQPPSLPLPALFLRRPYVARRRPFLRTQSRARTDPLPPSHLPPDPLVKLSLTTSKLWSPRPLRHPGPALGVEQAVSGPQAAACGRR